MPTRSRTIPLPRRAKPWFWLALCATLACGGDSALPPETLPSDHRDPPPHMPEESNDSLGIRVVPIGGGSAAVSGVALTFLQAVLELDRPLMTELLDESVIIGISRNRRTPRPRDEIVHMLELLGNRANRNDPAPTLQEVLQLDRMETQRAEAVFNPLPPGVRPGDVVLRIEFAAGGRRRLRRRIPNWRERAEVLIRPGIRPLIVGF